MRTDWKKLVVTADRELFNDHDVTALDRYFAPDYVEHSPQVADGLNGLRQLVTDTPQLRHDVARVLVDQSRQLVALHGSYTGLDPDQELVGFDIYRVEGDRIVEHWDGLVSRADANVSGNTQLDGPTEVDLAADTERSRALALTIWQRFLQGQDYASVADFTRADGRFIQHSPDIGDGVQEMVDFLTQLKAEGAALTYLTRHREVADGQFVLTHSEGAIGGERHVFFELFRFADGDWVELWDAIAPVPDDKDLPHPHGAFGSVREVTD